MGTVTVYYIVAHIHWVRGNTSHIQHIPTFALNASTHGLQDEDHAVRFATTMLGDLARVMDDDHPWEGTVYAVATREDVHR